MHPLGLLRRRTVGNGTSGAQGRSAHSVRLGYDLVCAVMLTLVGIAERQISAHVINGARVFDCNAEGSERNGCVRTQDASLRGRYSSAILTEI